MEIFDFGIDLISFFANVWEWLNTEVFRIGSFDVTLIHIFSTSILGIIITARLIALAIPN